MKKFLAILLAAMLLLGMTCAFADDPAAGENTITNVTTIKKVYTGALPVGDILTFEVEYVKGTVAQPADPLVTIGTAGATVEGKTTCTYTVVSSNDLTNDIPLDITVPDVNGVFTYKITETSTGNTNVTKVKDVIYLEVYKLTDGKSGCTVVTAPDAPAGSEKNDQFENAHAVGEVSVKKTIDGNAANYSDTFPATITLTSDKKLDNMKLQWNGEDVNYTLVDGTTYEYAVAVTLGGAQESTKKLTGVPVGVTVTLAEDSTQMNGYKASAVNGNEGVVNAEAALELAVTNTKNAEIPTGVYVDYIPYVVLLAVAVLGLVAFVVKRRMAANNDD